MTDTKVYALCQLARALNLPESTTRYYRDTFAQHVPWVGSGARRRYPEKALETLRFIAESYASGNTREQIEAALNSNLPTEADAQSQLLIRSNGELPSGYAQLVTAVLEGEREQRQLMWQMVQEITRFGDVVERQQRILVELIQESSDSSEHSLMPGQDEADIVVDEDVIEVEGKTPLDDGSRQVKLLEEELSQEKDLVERLRRSRLELERRTAMAEERLREARDRPGLLTRLLNRYD